MESAKATVATEGLLYEFSHAAQLTGRANVLREMVRTKEIHAIKDSEIFQSAVSRTIDICRSKVDPKDRLLAISIISRIASVVRALRSDLNKQLGSVLQEPLPDLSVLSDADDRYYVALALHNGDFRWIADYAATAAVREESGEYARQELILVLLNRVPNLSSLFTHLSRPLTLLQPETESPGDSAARRLRRLISAIQPRVIAYVGPAGTNIGDSLLEMFRAPFNGVSKPEKEDVKRRLTEDAINLLHDIVRTQISVVTDPNTYKCLAVFRPWFPGGHWDHFITKSSCAPLVRKDIAEAILLLAKQGATDVKLIEQLSIFAGGTRETTKILEGLANEHLELNADIRSWLRNGGKEKASRRLLHAEESSELSADSQLAMTLVEANRVAWIVENVADKPLNDMRILEPELSQHFSGLLVRVKALVMELNRFAERRRMQVRGNVGDVVDFHSNVHELVGGSRAGVRRVRIVRPMVERVSLGGETTVVTKALVEEHKE